MTAISQTTVPFTSLSKTVNGWMRWLRLQRALKWSLRGLVGGLALALMVGVFEIFQAQLLETEFFGVIAVLLVVTPLVAGSVAYLWPIQPLKAARYFDRVFHLNERVSTALELHQAQHPDQPEAFVQKQLADALQAARTVRPGKALPWQMPLREGLTALIFIVLLGLTWFHGDAIFQKALENRAVQAEAIAQTKKVEQILSNIQKNDALTDAQKQALSAPLQQALNELKNNPSKEGAVSALTSASDKLQTLNSPEAQKMSQALKDAGSQAAAQKGSPLQSAGEKLSQGDTVGAANDLANTDVSKLSASQSQQLAGQLDAMSKSMADSNPQLAQNLKDAAQALKDGDQAKAQQGLDKAAQNMAQAGQQTAQSQVAGQTAQQLQQGAGQMMVAGGGGQQQAAQGQNVQSGNPQQNGQNGQGQSGQMPGTGTGDTQGQSQNPSNGGSGTGASSIPNGPGDGGESAYEQIYAPSLLGGKNGTTVTLPQTGAQGGDVVGAGPANPGDPGTSQVPYQQVYQQYDQSYHQAIENGQIPFEFLQAVRTYFNSLKP